MPAPCDRLVFLGRALEAVEASLPLLHAAGGFDPVARAQALAAALARQVREAEEAEAARPAPPSATAETVLLDAGVVPARDADGAATSRVEILVLRAEAGPLRGRTFVLAGRGTIGREAGSDVRIEDRAVSRRHATLAPDEAGRWVVTDLGGTSGTHVNERRIAGPAVLVPGDRVRVHTTVLVCSPPPTAP
jgi:hypothetical protein